LRQRQIAPAAAQEALAAVDTSDELAEATALWQRRFGKAPKDNREKARQVRFLMARGYAMGVALKVVRTAGNDNGSADDSA
jgi:regulatory protein